MGKRVFLGMKGLFKTCKEIRESKPGPSVVFSIISSKSMYTYTYINRIYNRVYIYICTILVYTYV